MSVPSFPCYENVDSKICDAQFKKDCDKLPGIYTQKFCPGSSAGKRPFEDSEIMWDNSAAPKLEMNVGANHVLNSSKQCCFSCHNLQNNQLIPTNGYVRNPNPQIRKLNPDSASSSPKSKPVIFPRRTRSAFTPADRRPPPSPVVISLELLDSLRGLSLPLAASTVGVSATAFKKACRRLGVTRWEYRRGPGRASSKNVAGPTGPVSTSRPRRASRTSRPSCTLSLRCCAGSSAGEDVDMELEGTGNARCETKEVVDWLRGGIAEAGSATIAEPEDDTLVLQMLALRWPLNTAVEALD